MLSLYKSYAFKRTHQLRWWFTCFKNKILSEKETSLFLEMTDDRNEIIHNYDENFSDLLYPKIKKQYFPVLKKLFEIISEK